MIWKYFNYNNKVIIQEADSLKENNYNKSWDDAISGWQEKNLLWKSKKPKKKGTIWIASYVAGGQEQHNNQS